MATIVLPIPHACMLLEPLSICRYRDDNAFLTCQYKAGLEMASMAGSDLECGRHNTDMSFWLCAAASSGADQCCTVAAGTLILKGLRRCECC